MKMIAVAPHSWCVQPLLGFCIFYGVGYCFIHSKGSAKTLQAIHLHANRLLISALISKDKFFEAKSLLLDMKAQDYDTEFVEEKLAEVEERIKRHKGEQ